MTDTPTEAPRRSGRAVIEYAATWRDEHGVQRVPVENRDGATAHVAQLIKQGLAAYVEMRRCQPWTRIGPVTIDDAVAMLQALHTDRIVALLEDTPAMWDLGDAITFALEAVAAELLDTFIAGYRLKLTAADGTAIRFEVMV